MQRRDFLTLGGLAFAGLALPGTRVIAAEALLEPGDVAKKNAWPTPR